MDFCLESLEQIRNRLLDLTARNRLLNFKHGRGGYIRVIDELPDQLCDLLFLEEDLEFLPIPEPSRDQLIEVGYIEVDDETGQERRIKKDPTAIEWAKKLNFETNFELPSPIDTKEPAKHQDHAIQTLLFPYEMESQLRGLRNKAETAIEETGANILFLSFGFLEWYESHDSDQGRLAPLFLVPVKLNRGKLNKETGTYIYTLSYTGEDILPNLSFREKLKLDFGLALPEVDGSIQPEAYFLEIKKLIKVNQPRWKLHRYCTLALLNFGKLLMYLDLDPERWPEGEGNIVNHPTVQQFFSSETKESDSVYFPEEYEIDSIADIHETYPLIDDADSSQHSALIDAINGKNMVIEGPPGTGKSQTITNLIAGALSQNKKVLFVAEKLAALQVVKHRLDKAGLGDFCLELHSHKTQKSSVLQNINTRLINQNNYKAPRTIKAEISRYEQLKNELWDYANLINQPWKQTGKSIHAILMIATRYRQQFGGIDTIGLHPIGFDGDLLTIEAQKQLIDDIDIYGQAYLKVSEQFESGAELQSHPWAGVNNLDLQIFDSRQVCVMLTDWNTCLKDLQDSLFSFYEYFEMDANSFDLVNNVKNLLLDLSTFKEPSGNELFEIIPNLQGEGILSLSEYIECFKSIQQLYILLVPHVVSNDVLKGLDQVEELTEAQKNFSLLGIDEQSSLNQLAKYIFQINNLVEKLARLDQTIQEIKKHFGEDFSQHISISEAGLSEFKNLVKLTCQLESPLWKKRNSLFDEDELDIIIPLLKEYLETLKPLEGNLKKYFLLDNIPFTDLLKVTQKTLDNGGFFKWLSPTWRKARKQIMALSAKPKIKHKKLQSYLKYLIIYSELKIKLEAEKRFKLLLGDYFCGIQTPVDEIEKLRAWYKSIRQYYGIGFGAKVALGQEIIDMPITVVKGIQSLANQGLIAQVNEAQEELLFIQKTFKDFLQLQDNQLSLLGSESALISLQSKLEKCLAPCQKIFKNEGLNLHDMAKLVSKLQNLKVLTLKWNDDDTNQRLCDGLIDFSIGSNQENQYTLLKAEATLQLAETIAKIKTLKLKESIYKKSSRELFYKILGFSKILHLKFDSTIEPYQIFVNRTQLNHQEWMHNYEDTISNLLIRNERALNNQDWLANWLDFARTRYKVKERGFSGLIKAIETKQLEITEIKAGYYLAIFDFIAREIFEHHPELAKFSGNRQKTLQEQFCQYDEKLKLLQQQKIAWKTAQNEIPAGSRGGKVNSYTELVLLQHECGKKKRHIPIRQLVKRSGQALLKLKPCFMMGPLSAAQYLPPGEIVFDLIVMDEASQMKPEEALGVIARGKQVVIVGDPKQLPPTSFFDRAVSEEGDDNTAIEESESILDAALPMFLARRLRWHYRSQHESLIAFSNHSFYNSDLVVFPSPHSDSCDYGVKHIRITRGRFVAQCNIEEAQVIAESVAKHLMHRTGESLGVVAMNAKQREQIERAIESLSKEQPELQEAMEDNRENDEPLFVKNLENVQGDERDVIFISCTYGPSEVGGRVMQRFGPINSATGWRRLNVLFTRSKKRMHIFSSMGAEDILVSERSSRGVKAFKDFLAYAETGYLHQPEHTGRPPDSDFEIAVSNSLRDAGFETEPQVGVAGFYIDLAVIDPGKPGRYLMGIECDGATYHSAKSARDRDRLRQSVLERLGWRIHRIWSTDWFKNPQAEILPLVQQLNQLKTDDYQESEEKSESEVLQGIVHEHIKEEQAIEPYLIEPVDLKTKLEHFNCHVICEKQPETPENKRLLRPAMMEALLEFLPETVWEFKELIPPFLREGTASNEGKYIEQVLEIIREYEMEVQ
jgi:very-short-patch-repair endonuclease